MGRRQMFFAVFVVGLVLAGIGSLAVYEIARFADIERTRLQDRVRTNSEIEAVARRVYRVEQPSNAELTKRIVDALIVCSNDMECRQLFTTVARP